MPKGVLWRHDDIFFAAMGGGDPFASGNHITRPEELADRVLRPGVTALAMPPFMHAAGHWLAFSTLFGGGTVVTTPGGGFDPTWCGGWWRTSGPTPWWWWVTPWPDRCSTSWPPVPDRFDLTSLMAVGSGGAVLSPSTKAQLAELLPGRIVADRFGSSETGQVGGEAPTDDPFGPPRLRVDERTAVLGDDLRPVGPGSGVVGHLARGGRVPIGLPRRPARPRRPRSSSGTGPGGRCPVTWRPWPRTGRSPCSDGARCASTPGGRRSSPTRSRPR